MERRSFLTNAAASALLAAVPVAAAAQEEPMAKIRRLGKELSEALASYGEHEYAYVRPANVENPVLFANRSEPAHLAKFYFNEYFDAVTSDDFTGHDRQIRQLAQLLSLIMEKGSRTRDYIVVRPASVGDWAVSEYERVI